MVKIEELSDPNSCMARAAPHEMTFVLLARDVAAPEAIRRWASLRVEMGKNQPHDLQIVDALRCAAEMERQLATGELDLEKHQPRLIA